jgi:hypothetical protein
MDRVQEFESLFRGDRRFSSAVIDVPPDKWATEYVNWVKRVCIQIPPSTNNDAIPREYTALICPYLRRIVFSFKGEKLYHGDTLETGDALLLWKTMNAAIKMR